MTVTALPRLPPELVLLVIEHAASSEVFSSTSWVATLCLVCKVFRCVVTPILYDHITLDDDTQPHLATTSTLLDTPLAYTRSVHFACHYPDKPYTNPSFKPFARALANISTFTGPTLALIELSKHAHDLKLSSAYITDVTFDSEIAGIQGVVNTLTWLHLICELCDEDLNQWPDLSSSHVEYLTIDLFVERDTIGDERYTSINLSPMTSQAVSPPRLRRVLIRPRFVYPFDVQRVARTVVDWATKQRDQRIYIDDMSVPVRDAEGKWLSVELDQQDAMVGHSVWLCGRQAWHPPSPTLYHSNSS
ncbi:hypothetical protein EXIGLDRAFT_493963 [Exidia glandulosa HHB12029]|uniref:F-box domain-containing protein n=1 Tax=Exidia glandulosa HHB12029 TaxID=1314781 RepID=A0A166NAH8_EXIGL|nr:hypothetical protein EXIGLDRAFT_493963 [Exidia glandulosa HHB12029]